jgi:DNA-binding SARP family transcriptional activator/tetratricopeptide (TPR) repeat protein
MATPDPPDGTDHGRPTEVGNVRFEVLGPVRAWLGDAELDIGPPTQVSLLSLLLVHAGRPVGMGDIVDVLWGEDPPRTAVNIVHRAVGALRRLTDPDLPARATGKLVLPSSGGYRLAVDADMLDLLRFRELRARARAASGAQVYRLLAEALALWRGPVAAGTAENVRARPEFEAVTHEYLVTLGAAADAAVSAGSSAGVLPMLRQAAADHPLDEVLQAKLITTLVATGNHTEARDTYESVRERLADELGVDPGPDLHRALEHPRTRAIPSQLPADLPGFTGRDAELAKTTALLAEHRPAMTCVAISGMAGVGKTTLAVHFAHEVAGSFPDGLLYVHMRGYAAGGILSSAEAVGILLETLGVPSQRVPDGLDARTALYRSTLAGKRVLVLIDDARDAEHARPLLPGTPDAMAIVTSRDRLLGLVARNGAHLVALGLPTHAEAHDLLARRIGAGRMAAEPDAAAEIIVHCGRLPLALAVVAARAVPLPGLSLAVIAAQLRAEGLAAFDADIDVHKVFSWSYHAVSPDAARMYRLLALHPGSYISAAAAASLAGLLADRSHTLLDELFRAHLINEQLPGRYVFHDLLRAHAAELVTGDEAQAAETRLAQHYLHSARSATAILYPYRRHRAVAPAGDDVTVMDFAGHQQAEAWLRAERPALLAVADQPACGWHLAAAIELFLDRQGRWHEQVTLQRSALAAAEDALGRAHAHRSLGFACGRLDDHDSACVHLDQALALFQELQDMDGAAITHRYLAFLANRRTDHDLALMHYDHALKCYETNGDERGQAAVHNDVGWTYILLGDYAKTLVECEHAVRIQEKLGNRNGEASAADSVGNAYHHLGRNIDAITWYERALRLYREIKDPYLEANTLTHIGEAYDALGDDDAAATAWRQALVILDELAHPDAEQVRSLLAV